MDFFDVVELDFRFSKVPHCAHLKSIILNQLIQLYIYYEHEKRPHDNIIIYMRNSFSRESIHTHYIYSFIFV